MSVVRVHFSMEQRFVILSIMLKINVNRHLVDAFLMLDSDWLVRIGSTFKIGWLIHV
jgi:hypothetical protein